MERPVAKAKCSPTVAGGQQTLRCSNHFYRTAIPFKPPLIEFVGRYERAGPQLARFLLAATQLAPGLWMTPENRGHREGGAHCAPIASRGNEKTTRDRSHYRCAATSGLPCAMVYGLFRTLPGVRDLLVTVTRRHSLARLAPAQGCQDHTALPSAFVPLVARHEPRPSHPAPRS